MLCFSMYYLRFCLPSKVKSSQILFFSQRKLKMEMVKILKHMNIIAFKSKWVYFLNVEYLIFTVLQPVYSWFGQKKLTKARFFFDKNINNSTVSYYFEFSKDIFTNEHQNCLLVPLKLNFEGWQEGIFLFAQITIKKQLKQNF